MSWVFQYNWNDWLQASFQNLSQMNANKQLQIQLHTLDHMEEMENQKMRNFNL